MPNVRTAGRLWAGATVALSGYLKAHGYDHVTAAAADDVEPAWDPGFTRTFRFFKGFDSANQGHLIYNYGSLDGGVGQVWSLRQAFFVAGGMREARAVPEIYTHEMAAQWAELAHLAARRYHRTIQIEGLMTQHWTNCAGCGYTAPRARQELRRELALAASPTALPPLELSALTNIGADAVVAR